jgi:hypothetical protein
MRTEFETVKFEGVDFKIESELLDLFDLVPKAQKAAFLDNQEPLNIYQQYLYGLLLWEKNDLISLEGFINSIISEDVALLLKARLSLLRTGYKIIENSLWKKLEEYSFHNPLFHAEKLDILANYYRQKGYGEYAMDVYNQAVQSFKSLGLHRRSLLCQFHLCDINRNLDPEKDNHISWASIVLEAKKLGDEKLYMSALSKLSFSL